MNDCNSIAADLSEQQAAPTPAVVAEEGEQPVSQPYKLPEVGEVGKIADHILAELLGFHPRHRVFGELTVARLTRAGAMGQQQQHSLKLALQAQLDLLMEQQAAPAPAVVPVPVSERPWEREGWCDKRGRCWYGAPDRPGAIACWDLDFEAATDDTHSLPYHAIPLPQAGEGES